MKDANACSDPTVLVVFGATGDLMERKIVPALYHLHRQGRLPDCMRVIGFARRPIGDEGLRAAVEATVERRSDTAPPAGAAAAFAGMFTYRQGTFEDPAGYEGLRADLSDIDAGWGRCANKLFYLAVPPQHYGTIFGRLADSGLAASCGGEGGWTRVLVEKPFGKDARTAQELDTLLGSLFAEEQIYRIDHYLAKEMLQGIMAFRFGNSLLEPSWSARGIERIEIDLLETLTAEGRGPFYDGIGALRDVGQNHLLQMLALITMRQPAGLDAASIRERRMEALRGLRPPSAEAVAACTYRAQYDSFRQTTGVAPDSTTETFFRVETWLDAPGWHGVPVVLTGGKGLGTAKKDVTVTLRHPHPCLCAPGAGHPSNRVVFSLEPDEAIRITFRTKRPGLDSASLEERSFDFLVHERTERAQYVEEYAKLLADAIAGDQTLFVSTGEVRTMWEFIDPIVEGWSAGAVPLATYAEGTDTVAAEAADALRGAGRLAREVAVVGLGRMGAGLARNLVDHGWRVAGFNRTASVTRGLEPEGIVGAYSPAELAAALTPPRVVWVMLTAGAAVDAVLFGDGGLASALEPGDTIIDGGNSHYVDDPSRAERLAALGVRFVDVGVSGGPAGAREGACLMVGGSREDFERLRPLWEAVSVGDGYRHFPGVGAGHFVKMVHNGIEYGMMQAIAEGFTLLRESRYSLDLTAAAEIYDTGSVIESRLVAWLGDALRLHGPGLDGVSGTVGATGEGEWTVEAARALGVKAKVIESALDFRRLSAADPDWTGRVLSALREQFGRHPVDGS